MRPRSDPEGVELGMWRSSTGVGGPDRAAASMLVEDTYRLWMGERGRSLLHVLAVHIRLIQVRPKCVPLRIGVSIGMPSDASFGSLVDLPERLGRDSVGSR